MKITADTITDKQIRDLKAWADKRLFTEAGSIAQLCRWALERGHVQRYAARAQLAEILNARAEELIADTLTEQQIRDAHRHGWIDDSLLRSALPDASNAYAGEIGIVAARIRCAKIINARKAK